MVKCRKFTNQPIIQGRECQLSLYRPIDLSSGFTVCNSQWSRRFHRSRSDDEDPHATDSVSLLCHLASVAKHSSLHTDVCPQIPYFSTRPQQFGLLQQSPDRLASHSHPPSPVIPKCRSKAHFQPETLWPHHRRAHQSSLAPHARANYIQGGDADVSCTAWFRTT